ncbi:MAG: hypothetical protein ACRCSS_20580, partial [Shewanella sp.]
GYDDPFSGIDLSQFSKTYTSQLVATKDVANKSSAVFDFDIPADVHMVVLDAIKQMADMSVRPVAKLDWNYSNANKRLTVSFGETVAIGRVTIGIYV